MYSEQVLRTPHQSQTQTFQTPSAKKHEIVHPEQNNLPNASKATKNNGSLSYSKYSVDQKATKETQNYVGSVIPGIQQHELCGAHPHILFSLSRRAAGLSQPKMLLKPRTYIRNSTKSQGARPMGTPRAGSTLGGGRGSGAAWQWRPRFLLFLLLPRSVGDVEVTCNSERKPLCSHDHGRSCEDASLRIQQALQVIPVSALEQNAFSAIRVSPKLGINPFSPRCLDT